MARKAAPKRDDPEQSKRFVEIAKEVGADTDATALDRALKKITTPKDQIRRQTSAKRSKERQDQT